MDQTPEHPDGEEFDFRGEIESAPGVLLTGRFRGHYENGVRMIEHIEPESFTVASMPASRDLFTSRVRGTEQCVQSDTRPPHLHGDCHHDD